MKKLVVGFAFDPLQKLVLLVRKKKPDWQKGFWNGIGGKAEEGENPTETMIREFKEETSLDTNSEDWTTTVVMEVKEGPAFVYFFKITIPKNLLDFVDGKENDVGETMALWPVNSPGLQKVIPNLQWLIPFSLSPIDFPTFIIENKRGGFQN